MTDALLVAEPESAFVPDADILVAQINMLSSEATFCSRVAGNSVFRASMERMEADLADLARNIAIFATAEADGYNELVDAVEARDNSITNLRLQLSIKADELHLLRVELGQSTGITAEEKRSLEREVERLAQRHDDLKADHAEALRRLTVKLKTTETELSEARGKVTQLRKRLGQEMTAHDKTSLSYNKMQLDHIALLHYRDYSRREQDIINGFCGDRFWQSSANPGLKFYMHFFMYPLQYPNAPRDVDQPAFVNNLNFHINLRSTYGVDLVARISEWGIVQYQNLAIFKNEIPQELYNELTRAHHALVAVTNPHLASFFEYADRVKLVDVPELKPADVVKMAELEITTLAHLGNAFTSDLEKLKGIGEVTARKIRSVAYVYKEAWEAELGPIEIEKPMLPESSRTIEETISRQVGLSGQTKGRADAPTVGRSKKHRKGKK
ncbi:TPA: hypothetical protein ACGFAK_004583 [Serratia marcescens]|uniref:hypothetical protein n=1 Tax=Serratia TaxID=613 RepID=UPI00101F71F7|nr:MULTISPECIES: hypothetical protein [Serratia]MBP1133489.1 hypothetical protein [Serratia sp. PL17]RYM67383.1 hypothetical protein BSQ99_24790 [Serratia liquefaciens]HBL7242145.1 hypothetical protein [Serratia liquefaciens]HDS5482302.1 hypothetical protein [Serratia liquefaciens]